MIKSIRAAFPSLGMMILWLIFLGLTYYYNARRHFVIFIRCLNAGIYVMPSEYRYAV